MRRMGKAKVRDLRQSGDYHALYIALMGALPVCMACGRWARFMTTGTSEFACGFCDGGAPEGDEWQPVPWKAHVDVAFAMTAKSERERAATGGKR